MKTVCAFVLLALAASAGTASATTVAKIETSVSNIDVEVQGTVTFGQAESKAQLTINVGSTSTGKVTIENIITIKTPSCKSGEATLSTDGSIALTAPSQFTTAYTTAKTAVSALPDLDEGVKIKYSKSMGTGQAIEYDIPVSNHPMMKATGSGVTLSVNMANVGVMAKGVKVPLDLKIRVLDTAKVDVGVPCDGDSKPCTYGDLSACAGTPCKAAYCSMCSALKSAFSSPIIRIDIDLMDILATAVNGTDAAAMFVACPGTGGKKCLAVGDVSGECTAADKLSDKDSAGAKALAGTLAMGLAAAAMAMLH